jgi:hypothetical protein
MLALDSYRSQDDMTPPRPGAPDPEETDSDDQMQVDSDAGNNVRYDGHVEVEADDANDDSPPAAGPSHSYSSPHAQVSTSSVKYKGKSRRLSYNYLPV